MRISSARKISNRRVIIRTANSVTCVGIVRCAVRMLGDGANLIHGDEKGLGVGKVDIYGTYAVAQAGC
jgi:hypothetical protein